MSYSYFGCVVGKDRQVAKFTSTSWTHDDPFGKPFELEMSWVCTALPQTFNLPQKLQRRRL